MYLCVRGIDFAPFYAISIGFWNCSDSVVFFFWGGGLGFFLIMQLFCWILYCLMFPRGVVRVLVGYIIEYYSMMLTKGVVHAVGGYFVELYCVGFARCRLLFCWILLCEVSQRSDPCCGGFLMPLLVIFQLYSCLSVYRWQKPENYIHHVQHLLSGGGAEVLPVPSGDGFEAENSINSLGQSIWFHNLLWNISDGTLESFWQLINDFSSENKS